MDIRKPRILKQTAAELLSRSPNKKRIMLVYCGIVLIQCAVITGLNYLVDHQLSQAGGLGNLGTRTLLSTFAMVLPILHTLALIVLDVGLYNAMLRISRGQYTSGQSLRMGLSRFWGVIGCTAFRLLLCIAVGLAAMNISVLLYSMTPFFSRVTALLQPMLDTAVDPTAIVNELLNNEVLTAEYVRATVPLYIIFAVISLVLLVPMIYRLRFSELVLIDNPRFGGFRASLESFRITRRRWTPILKLDLSFWWYHVLTLLVGMLCYADLIMPLFGFALPWSAEINGLVFYGLYLVAQVLVYYFLRPRLEVSKSLIYNEFLPKEEENQGVVLGNIFQM